MVDPAKVQAHAQRRQARQAAEAGDIATARARYIALAAEFPTDKRTIEDAAGMLAKLGHLDDAIAILDEARARVGDSPVLLRCRLAILVGAQRWADAADILGQMAALTPADVNIFLEWARFAEAAERYTDAAAAYRSALTLVPDSTTALNLAGILITQNHLDEAERLIDEEIERGSCRAEARAQSSRLLVKRGRKMDALTVADAAIAEDPQNPTGHCARGHVLLDMNQPVLAAMAFRRALALEPDHRSSLVGLNATETGRKASVSSRSLPPTTEASWKTIAHSRTSFHQPAPGTNLSFGKNLRTNVIEAGMRILKSIAPERDRFKTVLDLYCRSGWNAVGLAKNYDVARMVGTDISPRYLQVAAGKNIFTQLVRGTTGMVLNEIEGDIDLIVAIEMFTWVGTLGSIFGKIGPRLSRNGMLLYSIDVSATDRPVVMPTGRFAHPIAYVESMAAPFGLVPQASEEIATRIEYGKPVTGHVGVLARV